MFSYSLVTTLLCVASASMVTASFNETDQHWTSFQKFITRFDKSYSNLIELENRFKTFKSNVE